jgi:hypothetical protein
MIPRSIRSRTITDSNAFLHLADDDLLNAARRFHQYNALRPDLLDARI